MRIIHLPVDLGGHASGLAAAQRALGHEAEVVSLQWSALGFNGDRSLDTPLGTPGRLLRREKGRLGLFWEGLRRADVIHCHFGVSALSVRPFPVRDPAERGLGERLRVAYARALWLKDLLAWRLAGKVLAMSFYGDDIRPIAASVRRNPDSHLALPAIADPRRPRERLRGRFLHAIDRHVPLLYATNPDLLETLPARARFLPYSHCNPATVAPAPWPVAGGDDAPLRVVHMPTNRAVKGTEAIVDAVERLRGEGVAIQLTLVEGEPNSQAVARIADHHLLFDQLRVGWYGGVAVEAMARGRPVACFLHPGDVALAPPDLARELPVLQADLRNVAYVLRDCARGPRAVLAARGERSRRFAERWHDPARIAAEVLDDYRAQGAA